MYRPLWTLSNQRRLVARASSDDKISYMPDTPAAVSIIVPTYREQPNLRALVERTFRAVRDAGIEAEMIVVDDDSQDGTEETIRSLQADYPVRLIVRHEERGLATAVMAGMAAAQHDGFVVLDADLQHPPELIPALIRKLGEGDHDMVIGTRYGGGAIDEDWPFARRLVSRVATLMARPLVRLSDPMSGFFAIPRSTWERAADLDPVGYKIALELYVKGRCSRPGDVPIQFAARAGGESKLSIAEQVRYVRHLFRLYRFRFPWLLRVAVVVILIVLAALIWGGRSAAAVTPCGPVVRGTSAVAENRTTRNTENCQSASSGRRPKEDVGCRSVTDSVGRQGRRPQRYGGRLADAHVPPTCGGAAFGV